MMGGDVSNVELTFEMRERAERKLKEARKNLDTAKSALARRFSEWQEAQKRYTEAKIREDIKNRDSQ